MGTKGRFAGKASSLGIRILSFISGTIAALLIIYSAYAIYDAVYTQSTAFGRATDIFKYKPTLVVDDDGVHHGGEPSLIKSIVEDYTSWFTIDDTNIDYPVVQGKNDLYYASHDIYKKSSLTGAIYLAADNKPDFSDSYNILYGHHMDNGAMFGDLDKFEDETFFYDHQTGTLLKDGQSYNFTAFAVFETDAYDFNIYTPGNRDLPTVMAYIKSLSSIYDEETAEGTEKILIMSTCKDYVSYGRLLVAGKLTNLVIDDTPVEPVPVDPKPIPHYTEPEPNTWYEKLLRALKPTGSHYDNAWALMNLICLLFTFYLLAPLMHLVDKFGRVKKMRKINEEKVELYNAVGPQLERGERERQNMYAYMTSLSEDESRTIEDVIKDVYYNVDKFLKRFVPGVCLESAVVVASLILFILTTDFRSPMTLINEWTPFFAFLLLISWIIDRFSARYRTWLKRNEAIIMAYQEPFPYPEQEGVVKNEEQSED